MYLLEIDCKQNRLHLTLSEQFNALEAELLLEETHQRIQEIEPGFSVLCDLTTLSEFAPEARTHFRQLMDLFNNRGARKIIRVIPDPLNNFGLTIMSHFHFSDNVHLISCNTLKEALDHL